MSNIVYIKVITPTSLEKLYEYKVPEKWCDMIFLGSVVSINFNRRNISAFVMQVSTEPEYDKDKIKEISSIHSFSIPSNLILLAKWLSSYYICPLGQVFQVMIPSLIRTDKFKVKRLVLYAVNSNLDLPFLEKEFKRKPACLRALQKIKEIKEISNEAVSQKNYLELLKISSQTFKKLLDYECFVMRNTRVERDVLGKFNKLVRNELDLSAEQMQVVKKITKNIDNKSKSILLHGVTGSGKTEVFLRAIQRCMERKEQVILLVPEIALTHQTIQRVYDRFKDKIALLHSKLSEVEKNEQWLDIYEQEIPIIIGARSAIFAPVKNLGLIVVDEEHEQSYKQENILRYNLRDVALVRAKQERAIVLFASATPSFETYQRALDGKLSLLSLTKRVENRPMPKIELINMKVERLKTSSNTILSQALIQAIRETIFEKSQVILLLNRRGYAPKVKCQECEYILSCEDCDSFLIYHRYSSILSCSYCDFISDLVSQCPRCSCKVVEYNGVAIEKVEGILKKLFPHNNIARLDSDIIRTKNNHIDILNRFKKKETDILIGTQIVAKGLDFPSVTLAGVVVGDASLNFPSYRANEKSFQLLTQVAGRSGRGNLTGKVLIQSYDPSHSVFDYVLKSEYRGFFREEMMGREALFLPPYSREILLVFISENSDLAESLANQYYSFFERELNKGEGKYHCASVIESSIPKIRRKYYWQLNLFLSNQNIVLAKKLVHFSLSNMKKHKVVVQVNVDP